MFVTPDVYDASNNNFKSSVRKPYFTIQASDLVSRPQLYPYTGSKFSDKTNSEQSSLRRKTMYKKSRKTYRFFKAFELKIPGLMLCFVAMPGPFLEYMSGLKRRTMRIYQTILYICFAMYEVVRLWEYILDYLENPTSLICFFHSCINTCIVPIVYVHVAWQNELLRPLLNIVEATSKTDMQYEGYKARRNFKRYIAVTTVILLTFHCVNVARSVFEEAPEIPNRSVVVDVMYFLGKQAHHFVIQTMYCGLQSLSVAFMFLLFLQFQSLTTEARKLKNMTEDKIISIQNRYRSLTDVYDSVQIFFGPLFFLFFFRTMFDFISSITYYSLQTDFQTKVWVLAYEGLLTLMNVWQCTAVSEMAQFLESEMRNTLYIVSKVPADEHAAKIMLIFLQVFKDRPDPMYGCGVLRINRSLMFTMYGSTLTVILVLIQMDPKLIQKLSLHQAPVE